MSENHYEETESERYTKQLIRINQVGIMIILGWIYTQSGVYPFMKLSVYGLIGVFITLNILAYAHSAYGFNAATWISECSKRL